MQSHSAKVSPKSHKAPDPEEVARLAFWLFEYEGRPENRELDHWLAAESTLKMEQVAVESQGEKSRGTLARKNIPSWGPGMATRIEDASDERGRTTIRSGPGGGAV